MSGVEILAANEVAQFAGFNLEAFAKVFWVGFALSILGGLVSGFFERDFWLAFCIIFIGAGVSVVLGFFAGMISFDEVTGHYTEYKVTVSDEVSMNEFLERYEIIDQEGKIYTVVEREDN